MNSRIILVSVIALGLTAAGAATGCGSSDSHAATPPPATPPPVTPASATPLRAASLEATADACVTAVFDRMTEAQRVGQLFLVGIPATGTPPLDQIRDHHFGSVLLSGDTTSGTTAIKNIASQVQALTAATAGVKFFVAANQEGGQVQQLKGPGFETIPSALTQGTMTPAELTRAAYAWGRELRSAGVNLDLAPVMDVVPPGTAADNAPVGALDREFGNNPATTGVHGAAFIRGMRQAGVATSAKHFPGLGRVRGNTDFTGGVTDGQTTVTDPYLESFQAAIDAGVPFVMVALATYTRIDPDHPAVFSTRIIKHILRGQLHFNGAVISDDLGDAAAVANITPGIRALDFLRAGGDMIVSQAVSPAVTMDQAVLAATQSNAAIRADVSTAVLEVLGVKQSYGLLNC
jgi:beta-N-acetylhexosaminidase